VDQIENTATVPAVDTADAPVTAPAARLGTMPTQAALDGGKVGDYTLEKTKGVWRLRNTATSALVPEAFENKGDAGWYAQRLSRLAQVRAANAGKLFMPKVRLPAGWTIAGTAGALRLLNDKGAQVGPTWTHKSNGRIDAFRYYQRITRPGGAA
jgi:hypothetical protein